MVNISHSKNKFFKSVSCDLLVYSFPIFAILGAPAINFLIVLTCLFYLQKIERINLKYIKKKIYLLLIFIFWLYIFLLSFFSKYNLVALNSSFFYIRFLIFGFAVSWIVINKFNHKIFINYLLIVILFIDFDILLQHFTGYDIFGYKSSTNRLGGPFGDELIAGAFLSKISLPILFLSFYKIQVGSLVEKLLNLFLIILTSFCILITGDRLPFVHILIFLFIGLTFLFLSFKKGIISFFIILIILFTVINFSNSVKNRFEDTKKIVTNFSSSSYYSLYENAIEVWKINKFFGVGIKNYRFICDEITRNYPVKNHQFCSSHPHNIILELMVSSGIVGTIIFYSIFFFFFKQFLKLKKKNLNNDLLYLFLGSCLTILFYLNPLSTTGSIFNSWNASFLWFHFGLSLGLFRIMMKGK
jgi:O-antigen ligase